MNKTYRATHTATDGAVSTHDFEAPTIADVLDQILEGGFADANTQSVSIAELIAA